MTDQLAPSVYIYSINSINASHPGLSLRTVFVNMTYRIDFNNSRNDAIQYNTVPYDVTDRLRAYPVSGRTDPLTVNRLIIAIYRYKKAELSQR